MLALGQAVGALKVFIQPLPILAGLCKLAGVTHRIIHLIRGQIEAIGHGVEQRGESGVALLQRGGRAHAGLRLRLARLLRGVELVDGDALGHARLARLLLGDLEPPLELRDARLEVFQSGGPQRVARLIQQALRLLRLVVALVEVGPRHAIGLALGAVRLLSGAQPRAKLGQTPACLGGARHRIGHRLRQRLA